MSRSTVVILGAGQAGFQAASSLREAAFDGRIVLVGDEPVLPYQRPPLSKAYLTDLTTKPTVRFRPENFYSSNDIELLIGERAVSVDRGLQRIELKSGGSLDYDHLVLALGTRPRLLDVPGGTSDGVFALRTLDDAEKIRERLGTARRIVIVGGGFIGLEVAAAATKAGIETVILDVMPRVLSRSASERMSQYLTRQHAGWGSVIALETGLGLILGGPLKVTGVVRSDGRTIAADLVLVGIGVVPNEEIAGAAGLAVNGGIVVDEHLRTADPTIFAIGDCARFPSRFGTGPLRLESVQNAIDQGKSVAATLTGHPKPYDSVPWFWSDQGPLKLQIVGITDRHDATAMRGDPAENRFSIFCYRNGKLVGIESINRPADHMSGRRFLAKNMTLTPEQAADVSFDLKALASV